MTELALLQCQRALAAADALADLVEGDHHDHICQVRREHDLECGLEARCRCGWWQIGDAPNRLVWADDRRIDGLHVRRFLERDDPRLEVVIQARR